MRRPTPIQFQPHDNDASRLEKLRRLADQVGQALAREFNPRDLEDRIDGIDTRLTTLEGIVDDLDPGDGIVQSVEEGQYIEVDATDPRHPIISVSQALINAVASGTRDHHALNNLTDGNDHSQYPLKGGDENITGQWDFLRPIRGADGVAGTPTFTYTSDQNTGRYLVGPDNEGITTGGVLRWDINTTRVFQNIPLVVRNYSGAFVENPDYLNAGLELTTITGLDPLNNGIGNQIAFWEVGTGGAFTDRSYGFRIRHTGELNSEGNLDWYRHNNDVVGTLFVRMRRDTSQVAFADGTSVAPVLSFLNETTLGAYRIGSGHIGISATNVTHAGSDGTSTSFIQQNTGSGTAGFSVANTAGAVRVRLGYSNATSRPFINVSVAADMTFQQAGSVDWTFTSTGDWRAEDSNELQLGTGGDLRLFHNGTNSTIRNDTGQLSINSSTTEVLRIVAGANGRIHGLNGTAALPTFGWFGDTDNGFYYIGTNNFGTSVGGTLRQDWTTTAMRLLQDNYNLQLGASQDLSLGHDGTNSFITNVTGDLNIAAGSGGDVNITGNLIVSGNIFSNATPRNIWLGDLNIQSVTPQVILTETDAALDQKWWDLGAQNEQFFGRLFDDAQTTTYNWLEVERSGTGVNVTADLIRLRAPVMTPSWLSVGADASAGPNGSGVAIGVNGISGLTASMDFSRFENNGSGPNLVFGKSRGATVGAHTIVQNGDIVGQFIYSASSGVGFTTCASLRVIIDGTPGVGDMPTRFQMLTSPDGSATPVERFEVMPNGAIRLVPLAADPASGLSNGQMYYNSTTNKFRGYAGGAWVDLH